MRRLQNKDTNNGPIRESHKLKQHQANRVDERTTKEDSDQEYSFYCYNNKYSKSLMVTVMFNYKVSDLKLYIGVSVSLISQEVFYHIHDSAEML